MNITLHHIDNGWYKIHASIAGKLAKKSVYGKLPAQGRAIKVTANGSLWWLGRTPTWGKVVWSIHSTEPVKFGPFPLKIKEYNS